jgi:hypothetical protein
MLNPWKNNNIRNVLITCGFPKGILVFSTNKTDRHDIDLELTIVIVFSSKIKSVKTQV